MANTYTLIASTTLNSTQSSISLSSIPSTYTDLELHISPRFNVADNFEIVSMQLNSDTGSNYYSNLTIQGYNGSANSNAPVTRSYIQLGYVDGANATASTFGSSKVYIPNYASTTQKRTISAETVMENNSSSNYVLWLTNSRWENSANAINSISLSCATGGVSFVSGTSAYLYGIKNS
jgi:hypothetical protein